MLDFDKPLPVNSNLRFCVSSNRRSPLGYGPAGAGTYLSICRLLVEKLITAPYPPIGIGMVFNNSLFTKPVVNLRRIVRERRS